MSEDKVNELVEWVSNTAKETEGFLREQAPLVAQEILDWHLWSSAFLAMLFAVIFLAVAIPAIRGLRWALIKDNAEAGAMSIISLLASIIPFSLACNNIYSLVKVLTAPRLVILEFLKTL